jgi:hypothetical protein
MGKTTENCSRKLVCHFTEKLYMRLFLGIGYRIEKNIDFAHIKTWSQSISHLTHGT